MATENTTNKTPNPFVDPLGFKQARQPANVTPTSTAAETSNPFVNPAQFKQARTGINQSSTTRPVIKDAPNPFVYPQEFAGQRKLTAQMSATPELVAKQPEPIQDASSAPASADPLGDAKELTPESIANPFLDFATFKNQRIAALNEWTAMVEAVQDIAVVEVASELGGIGGQDGDPNKYKIRGDNVQINGQQWYNFNADEGSGGPVSMVMAFENLNRHDDAIKWLANRFKNRIGLDSIKASARSGEVREKPKFEPPENAPQFLDHVRRYLTKERGIDRELLERLIAEGRVYADPHKNVVMISKSGQIAELRGVEAFQDRKTGEMRTIKQLKPGSDKNSGAFMIPPDPKKIANGTIKSEKAVAIVEAGIDAMSYHMLFPGRAVASASGAAFNYPRRMFFQAMDNNFAFHCGFDADQAGDKASQNIYNSALLFDHFKKNHGIQDSKDFLNLFTRKILRLKLRPELHKEEAHGGTEDDESMDEGLLDNVLFFNKDNPFENPNDPPVVRYQVKQNNLGIPLGNFEIKVTPELHRHILESYKIHRDRPGHAKDWNELVKPKTNNLPKFG